jgi:hypothetical protein
MATFDELRGSTVYDSTHEKIGTLEEFYVDDDTNEPKWITIKTGLFGTKSNFVPLAEASETDDGLQVAFTKDQVSDAPNIDAGQEISQDDEDMLFSYYRAIYDAENGSDDTEKDVAESEADDTDTPDEAETDGDTENTAGTNDLDEEDNVDEPDTEEEDTHAEDGAALAAANMENQTADNQPKTPGTLRLKRYVVTENVQFTVPVKREVIRLEPADEEGTGTTGEPVPRDDEK